MLVATDKGIAGRIQESGYALKYEFWTRKPLDRQGAHKIEQPYYGMSSGPVAVSRACIRNHKSIYLLGFDLGGNDLFNNVYADTEFYKRSTDKATYAGNWISQLQQIFKIFSKVRFYRVNGIGSMDIKFNCDNNETVSIADFDSRINKL